MMDSQSQEIKLKSDGNCLDITSWSKDNGANIYIYECHPTDKPENQQVITLIIKLNCPLTMYLAIHACHTVDLAVDTLNYVTSYVAADQAGTCTVYILAS